jgi:hypothetical protein
MRYNILTLFLVLILASSLSARIHTTYRPLDVGEHWSRRAVNEEGTPRFYFRPDRFEFMQMDTRDVTELQIRGVTTERATSVDAIIRIGNTDTRHTFNIVRNDDTYFYMQPLILRIPAHIDSISIYTRNPFSYFRHYNVRHRQMRPRLILMEPIAYWNRHILTSEETTSEYFSGNSENRLTYRAEVDGDIHFFIRSIREGRRGVTVDILKNDVLLQTTVLPSLTSREYSIGETRVTTGLRVELTDISAGDTITIRPRTEHEIITRFFLTTKQLF